ncbi:hypothetical protein ACFFLM_19125 [Deinococcus oregonensis]|uniref:Uncharacterized protein n=1 Tax=Deinococcus oregonensis TaxID=1805970 RepID=A0ABV6B2U3_9DEIO
MKPLDITGTHTKMLRLPVTDDTREALAEREIVAPEFVILHLREATFREREKFTQMQQAKNTTEAQYMEWLASLILRRTAEPLDPVVVAEFIRDLHPTQITQLTYAYISGEAIEDPKAQEALAQVVKNQTMTMTMPVLAALANVAPLPFSPTSTE